MALDFGIHGLFLCGFVPQQMSPTGEHVNDVSDILTVGQTVDVRIREVGFFECIVLRVWNSLFSREVGRVAGGMFFRFASWLKKIHV